MTESDWLSSKDPKEMFAYLLEDHKDPRRDSPLNRDRKYRLFAIASWDAGHRKQYPDIYKALQASYDYADGTLIREEAVSKAHILAGSGNEGWEAWNQWCLLREDATSSVDFELNVSTTSSTHPHVQADLLREIFGNPFRSAVFEPEWRGTDPRMIPALAHAIYEHNTLNSIDMEVLADMLIDVGCTNNNLLEHLRGKERKSGKWHRCKRCKQVYQHIHKYSSCDSPYCEYEDYDEIVQYRPLPCPHVRGCWATDLILGKA